MKCAYCGEETKGTKEHIISSGVLDLFPECYLTFDYPRGRTYQADPVIKDVCCQCNNQKLTYIDSYAKEFIGQHFTQRYGWDDTVAVTYDYVMIQKMLLKYAYNDLRVQKANHSFFDKEMLDYLLNVSNDQPKQNITVLCGLAANVSPVPDEWFGNLKLRWCRDPILFSNSIVLNCDFDAGNIYINDNVLKEEFDDLQVSYVFRFNSVQFLLLCWDSNSNKVAQHNDILSFQYPYHIMIPNESKAIIPLCTNEINYHYFNAINVAWDGLFYLGELRRLASGDDYQYLKLYQREWEQVEKALAQQHPRK